MPLCQCGCGNQAKNRFVHGHNKSRKYYSPDGKKTCPMCQERKPFADFPKCGSRGVGSYCKPCHVKKGTAQEKIRRERSEEYRIRRRAQWAKNRVDARKRDKQRHIDIAWRSTLKLRKEMVTAYGGKCACCGESEMMFLTLGGLISGGLTPTNLNACWSSVESNGIPCRKSVSGARDSACLCPL